MQTKKELKHNLIAYKKILTNSIFDYLNSILELEFSVLKENIGDDERKLLTELSIYKEIAIYNIYNRALKLIKEKAELGITLKNKSKHFSIMFYNGHKHIPLFFFDASTNNSKRKNCSLGTINLYKSIYSVEKNYLLLEETEKELQRLYNEVNPYNENACITNPMEIIYDGPSVEWLCEHNENISYYKNILNRLNNRKQLSEEEKKIITITSTIHNILLEDYGLKEEDLIDENKQKLLEIENIKDETERIYASLEYAMQNYTSPYEIKSREDEIVLTKRFQDFTIKSNVRYII